MARLGIIALAVVCAIVLGLTGWLGTHGGFQTSSPPVTTPANSDYYMNGARIYQLDKQGRLAYRMTVGQSLHFPNESARLSDIHVHYIHNTTTYWDLWANKGRVPPATRNLYLYDGVLIHHPRPNGGLIKIDTTHAWVRPGVKRIDSDARVTAIEPGRKVSGNGMRINLETNKLNLLHDVHVIYTP